jgi:hypothetical protein
MQINTLDNPNSPSVAQLHITGIPTGFISSLGVGFVAELYSAISDDQNSFCLVAQEDGEILGFVAFSCNLGKLYKYVLKRKFSGLLQAFR